jgi:hypothetical protein
MRKNAPTNLLKESSEVGGGGGQGLGCSVLYNVPGVCT